MPLSTKQKLIIAVVLCGIFATIGYLAYTHFVVKKATGTTGAPNSVSGGGTSSQTPTTNNGNTPTVNTTVTPTAPANPTIPASTPLTLHITGINNADPYPRDWQLFLTDPSGKLSGSSGGYGIYTGLTPVAQTQLGQGATWNVQVPAKGTYYLIIGQSGGAAFGTYAGTISNDGANGQNIQYQGVDCQHAAQFTLN